MPPDGSMPHSPAGSAPGSPAKSGKFSWGFGRKSRTPSPSHSMLNGGNENDNDTYRGRKSNASPSSFVVKSVVRQPGGVSLDHQDDNGAYSQSPSSQNGPWSSSTQQFGDGPDSNGHNESYKRQKSRPVMSLGVPAGGPGGGVGYGGAHSSNDGRPEAELRMAAATNAGAVTPSSPVSRPYSTPSSPARPSSPSGGISAEQFQRKVRDRQNSIQNPRDSRQSSPVPEPKRAADIAAQALAKNAPAHQMEQPASQWRGGGVHTSSTPVAPPFDPNQMNSQHRARPIDIHGQHSTFRGPHDPFGPASPHGYASPGGPPRQFGPNHGDDDEEEMYRQDNRGRSASPGFTGFFKGIFGKSPKVESQPGSGPNGMYADEHAWMDHPSNAPGPYGDNSFQAANGRESPSGFRAPGPRTSMPSALRFSSGANVPQADLDEAEARVRKHDSMLQARRIVDEERQRAIDAAVQRRPSSGPDSPWAPRQVVPDGLSGTPPNRSGILANGRGAGPAGRKPVPQLDVEGPGSRLPSSTQRDPIPAGDALSRLENMLTPAQRIVQEARSKQLAEDQAAANRAARDATVPAKGMNNGSPATVQAQLPTGTTDKGKARQIDPPSEAPQAEERPMRRLSKRSPTKQVQIQPAGPPGAAPEGMAKANTRVDASVQPSQQVASTSASRTAAGLMPGTGPLPKDMPMVDALQEMMIRFYRFERYSVPLLRSLETRLLDIERDAQFALQPSDALSANSARDREMDRWVSEMTGMMKHEIGQLRAACREIKEGREILAQIAQADRAKSASTSAPVQHPAPVRTSAQVEHLANKPGNQNIASKADSNISVASGNRKVPGTAATPVTETMATASLTPATLRAMPKPDIDRSSPNSILADPGVGVEPVVGARSSTLARLGSEPEAKPSAPTHQGRDTNISSASFRSAVPVERSTQTVRMEPASPSVEAAQRKARAAEAERAGGGRSPSPTGKARPRYTAALGGSVLDSSTRARQQDRGDSTPATQPSNDNLRAHLQSPAPPSDTDTSRSNQSVEDRLRALLRGPDIPAFTTESSSSSAALELDAAHPASPPVTEHLRWRSKETSSSRSPSPPLRSGTPGTPNGASLHKESFFSGLPNGRSTPALSSSPEKGSIMLGLTANRHLKASSSSSLTNSVATSASRSAATLAPAGSGEGLSPRPGAWANQRFQTTSVAPAPPAGSAVKASSWLAADSTNTTSLGAGRASSWIPKQQSSINPLPASSQFRRTSNAGAVGANATLKEKLAFFDSAR
ncbi:hypothetical protein V8E36_004822 [Tilletia maclaganii]